MIDRDLYFYINAPTPYRQHMFQMYAKEFRHALFHFYQRATDHPTWTLDSSDWGIDYVYDNPEDQVGFGRFKFTKRMLKRFFMQKRGSVYIGDMTTWGDRMLLNILGLLRLAVVIAINDAGFGDGISRWQRFKNRLNNFGVRAVMTPGKKGREYSKALGFRDNQIINCYFSHDVELFSRFYLNHHESARREIRDALGIDEKAVVALTICRFMALKRLEDAAEALLQWENVAMPDGMDFHYLLVGQGEWQAHIPLLRKLKRVKVHVMPDVSPLDVRKYYCAADFLLFPSEGDIWGLVVNEALSMHLPVICTSVIGAAEMVHDGENGFVVPPRAPKELARAIHSLSQDPALRERLGAIAFEGIKSWNTRRGLDELKAYLAG